MSTTNHTTNYELSQYIGTDVTSYLANYNSDMYKIDAQMKVNATAAAAAQSDASAAVSTATTAASNASAAVSTANAANTTAEAAQTAAAGAQTAAGAAQTDAAAALRASASNTIGNLAPAYDPTLTYAVGDLVTYVDTETNQGKLYKCIIAIAVPEEFNINKWDDVTTSEAFAPNHEIIYERTLTENVTTENVLADLLSHFSELTSDLTKDLKLIFTSTNGVRVYNTDEIDHSPSNGLLKFSRVNCSKGGIIYSEMLAVYEGDSTKVARMISIATDGTVSSLDTLSDNVVSGITIRIIRG